MISSLTQLEICIFRYIQATNRFPISVKNFIPLLKNYAGDDWKQITHLIDNTTDTTTKNTDTYKKFLLPSYISFNKYFDRFIICWPPGFSSPIHNHADNGCCLKILQGSILETQYKYTPTIHNNHNNTSPFQLLQETKLSKNDVSYLDNSIGLHSIANPGTNWAVSLHIYSPQNFTTTYYN